MKRETVDKVVTFGSMGIAAVCALTGNCQIAVPILAGATVYQGVGVVSESRTKKKPNAG